jgi:hypothetical protein
VFTLWTGNSYLALRRTSSAAGENLREILSRLLTSEAEGTDLKISLRFEESLIAPEMTGIDDCVPRRARFWTV